MSKLRILISCKGINLADKTIKVEDSVWSLLAQCKADAETLFREEYNIDVRGKATAFISYCTNGMMHEIFINN